MGTRNLTAVFFGGEYKVAQYGQWDGYPESAGITVLEFLRDMDRANFEHKIKNCKYGTEDQLNEEWAKYEKTDMDTDHVLSRDTGSRILAIIANSPEGVLLSNNISFAGDSLFCEWAYVVDLDTNKLEVYKGFNGDKLTETDRFFGWETIGSYEPVKKVAEFSLCDLPSNDEFLAVLSPENEEDGE